MIFKKEEPCPGSQASGQVAMVLLMGGKSRRMGTPKALLTLEGKTFFERITQELAACGPVYISVDKKEHVPSCPYPIIEDEIQEIGPVGGLLSVFHRISEKTIFLCDCDMPYMNREYIRALLSAYSGKTDGVLVRKSDGKLHMTGAVYSAAILPRLEKMQKEGCYRIRELAAQGSFQMIEEEVLGELAKALQNVNTPQEYEKVQAGPQEYEREQGGAAEV